MADPAELIPNEKQATPHADLIAQIMDSRVAKNEREWAAAREIERLTEALEAENAKTGISDEDMGRFRQLGIWMAGYGYNWEQIFRVTRAALTPQHSAEDAAVLDALECAIHDWYQHKTPHPPAMMEAVHAKRQAVLARMAGKVPEGWQLVPVVPTQEMVDAYKNTKVKGEVSIAAWLVVAWAAMLAAAPKVTP